MSKSKFKISNLKSLRSVKGVVSIATMLVLGAVVVQIGLVGFILSYYLNTTNAGVKFSSYAFSGARSGISEGVIRIMRDDYNHGIVFSLTESGGTVINVTICTGGVPPPDPPGSCEPDVSSVLFENKVQIVVQAGSFTKKSIIVAMVAVDPLTHAVNVESIVEKDQL